MNFSNIIHKFKKYNVLNLLLFIIFLNIIPVACFGLFNINQSVYSILVGIIYIVQSSLCLLYCYQNIEKIDKVERLILILPVINCFLSILFSFLKLNSINIKEIIFSFSLIYNVLIFIVLLTKFSVSKSDIVLFLTRLVFLGLVSVIINIFIHLKDFSLIFSASNSYMLSFSSFFPNRNQFGFFMLLIIISNTLLYMLKKEKKYIVYEFVFIVNLFLSMSRTSILGLFVFFFVLIFNQLRHRKKLFSKFKKSYFFAVIFIFFVLVLLILKTNILDVINTMFIRSDTIKTGSGRFELWKDAFSIVLNNNVFVSVGRFNAMEINRVLFNCDLTQFHSLYVEKFVTHGLLGLFWLFIVLYRVFKDINEQNNPFRTIFFSSFFCFLTISLFETTTRFSIGYADTVFTIFFFTLPLIFSNFKES